jgi:RNA polymerase subunit RPABC4/transcription elongation factor Spt4
MMTNTDKFIPKIEKTYQVQELEVKQFKLSPAARSKIINKSGSNYQSVRATINNPSYGPGVDNPEVKKYCYKCKKNKEVESDDEYCPGCGRSFDEEFKKAMAVALAQSNVSQAAKDISVKVANDKGKK